MGCCTHKLNKLFLQFSSFFAINNYFSEIERAKIGRKKNEEKSGSNYYYPTLELKVLPIFRYFFSLSDSTSADAKYLEGSTYSSSKSVQGESRAAARVFRFPGNSTGPLMIY